MIKQVLAALIVAILSGCATGAPYIEFGLGARIDGMSDWYLRSERIDSGNNPVFDASVGYEWPNAIRCEAYHWSHLLEGGPFNHKAENYELRARCLYRIGGIK